MSGVAAQLDAIEKVATHAQKIEEYKKLAERLFAEKDIASLDNFLHRLADDPPPSGEAVPTMISRQVESASILAGILARKNEAD
eukprot:1629108-Rhodomonas_salina.1